MKLKTGSALVYVLVFTAILLLCCSGLWRATMYGFSIVHKRQRYEQYFKATEGVFNYGVAWCKLHGKQLLAEKKTDPVEFSLVWVYQAHLTIEIKNEQLFVRATISHDGRERCAIHGSLVPVNDFKSFKIDEWSIESV